MVQAWHFPIRLTQSGNTIFLLTEGSLQSNSLATDPEGRNPSKYEPFARANRTAQTHPAPTHRSDRSQSGPSHRTSAPRITMMWTASAPVR